MSKQVRFRRGTTAQHAVFTGPAGEITVNTDKNVLVVHDGVTAGGISMLQETNPRGWTKTEVFTSTGTWTQTGKTDLKRLVVWCYGGGGNGSTSGGGQGGAGLVRLEASAVTTNVTVTVGGGGGGTSSFGTYISSTGGGAGGADGSGGLGGTASGSGVLNFGAGDGQTRAGSNQTACGAGLGRGNGTNAAKGIYGSGGGQSTSGSQGSVWIQEIYGTY